MFCFLCKISQKSIRSTCTILILYLNTDLGEKKFMSLLSLLLFSFPFLTNMLFAQTNAVSVPVQVSALRYRRIYIGFTPSLHG